MRNPGASQNPRGRGRRRTRGGLSIGHVLLSHGINVRQFGRNPETLKIVKIRGAIIGKKPSKTKFEFVIDATGSGEGLGVAIGMCRPHGTVVMKSTVYNKVAIDMASVIVPENTLVGSRCGRFAPALKLSKDEKIDVQTLIQGD